MSCVICDDLEIMEAIKASGKCGRKCWYKILIVDPQKMIVVSLQFPNYETAQKVLFEYNHDSQ